MQRISHEKTSSSPEVVRSNEIEQWTGSNKMRIRSLFWSRHHNVMSIEANAPSFSAMSLIVAVIDEHNGICGRQRPRELDREFCCPVRLRHEAVAVSPSIHRCESNRLLVGMALE
jgi:hypothetical protein